MRTIEDRTHVSLGVALTRCRTYLVEAAEKRRLPHIKLPGKRLLITREVLERFLAAGLEAVANAPDGSAEP